MSWFEYIMHLYHCLGKVQCCCYEWAISWVSSVGLVAKLWTNCYLLCKLFSKLDWKLPWDNTRDKLPKQTTHMKMSWVGKCFPHYWSFMREIHLFPYDFSKKASIPELLCFLWSFVVCPNKLLNKQLSFRQCHDLSHHNTPVTSW